MKESTVVSTRTTHLYLLIANHCTVLLLSQCSEWKNEKENPGLEKVEVFVEAVGGRKTTFREKLQCLPNITAIFASKRGNW